MQIFLKYIKCTIHKQINWTQLKLKTYIWKTENKNKTQWEKMKLNIKEKNNTVKFEEKIQRDISPKIYG